MLRISKLTDYATVVMTCLAEQPEAVHSAMELSERVRLELPTVSKLLKQLAHADLVESFRGASGGYRLARAAAEISVADIVSAIEGPFGMTECSAHAGQCGHESYCAVRSNWRRISQVIEQALCSVSLADILRPPLRMDPPRRIAVNVAAGISPGNAASS